MYVCSAVRNDEDEFDLTNVAIASHPDTGNQVVWLTFDGAIYPFHTTGKLCYRQKGRTPSDVMPDGIKAIAGSSFYYCTSLAKMIFPSSVTSITTSVFGECQGMAVYDFTHHTAVPTLSNTSSFTNIPADCVIKVPSALVDTWKSATNWSAFADKIVGV